MVSSPQEERIQEWEEEVKVEWAISLRPSAWRPLATLLSTVSQSGRAKGQKAGGREGVEGQERAGKRRLGLR